MGAIGETKVIKRDSWIPLSVEQLLRRVLVDRFTGNVQLNIKDGMILGIRKEEVISVPSHENR